MKRDFYLQAGIKDMNSPHNTTISIAILSGKGGVGKTNIALNLAYALYQRQYSNLLIDCDLGLANLDVLLGITPEGNMQEALLGNATIQSIIHPIEVSGFDILPAASGVPELITLNSDMRKLLLHKLEPVLVNYDYVFMDLGAGIDNVVQSFAAMAALRIVIITPEPTSLTDSYALIKVLSSRHNIRDFMVIVNQVESKKETDSAFFRLHGACKHFLGIEPMLLGSVRSDKKLIDAVIHQEPLLKRTPGSKAGLDIQKIAVRIQRIRLSMLDWLASRPVLTLHEMPENIKET